MVPLVMAYKPLSAGSHPTCAVTSPGSLKCWGHNQWGSVGNGTTENQLLPVDVSGLSGGSLDASVSAVESGGTSNCALTTVGGVKCWGNPSSFQFVQDWVNVRPQWVRLSEGANGGIRYLTSGARGIAVGGGHTCVLMDTGGVKCWGDNTWGQLGVGTNTNTGRYEYPVEPIYLNRGVREIVAGMSNTCARLEGGSVMCWGRDYGFRPVAAGVSSGAVALAGGSLHMCALLGTGGVKCWGSNNYGQLGDGSTTSRGTAMNVSGLSSGVTAIAAGHLSTCALTTAGGVKCWGENSGGQLGDGTSWTDRLTPVGVSGLSSGAIAIAAGVNHACALLSTGGIKCWGFNQGGILGDGTTTERLIPVDVVGYGSALAIATPTVTPTSTTLWTSTSNSNSAKGCWISVSKSRPNNTTPS